jgi:hypothetical protein
MTPVVLEIAWDDLCCLAWDFVSSRTATLGMYEALQILGYKPDHMAEIICGIEGKVQEHSKEQ